MKKTVLHRIISVALFAAYLVFLAYLLFFSEEFGRIAEERSIQYNIVPFKEILRYIVRADSIGAAGVAINLLGNIAAFLPFGFFLPFLIRFFDGHPWRTVIFGALVSAAVELLQLVSMVGCMDVDDVILNTVGVACGYGLLGAVRHFMKARDNGNDTSQKTQIQE